MKIVLKIFIPLCVLSFIAFWISVMFLGTQPKNADAAADELVVDSASTYDITDSFTSIKADIGAYKLTIKPWSKDSTQVMVLGDKTDRIKVSVSGDRLNIRSDWNWENNWNWNWDWVKNLFDGSSFSTEVTLKIPDKTYEQVMMYVGAGQLVADGVQAKDVYLDVGAGSLTYTQPLEFQADHFSADVSAGKLVVGNMAAGSYEVDVSAGDANIYGLTGSGSVDISAGSATLQFNELSEECDVDVSAGEVTLDIPEDTSAKFICDKSAGDIRIMVADENRHADDGETISINGGKTDVKLSVSAGSITVLNSTASVVEQNTASVVEQNTASVVEQNSSAIATTGTYAEAEAIEEIYIETVKK